MRILTCITRQKTEGRRHCTYICLGRSQLGPWNISNVYIFLTTLPACVKITCEDIKPKPLHCYFLSLCLGFSINFIGNSTSFSFFLSLIYLFIYIYIETVEDRVNCEEIRLFHLNFTRFQWPPQASGDA